MYISIYMYIAPRGSCHPLLDSTKACNAAEASWMCWTDWAAVDGLKRQDAARPCMDSNHPGDTYKCKSTYTSVFYFSRCQTLVVCLNDTGKFLVHYLRQKSNCHRAPLSQPILYTEVNAPMKTYQSHFSQRLGHQNKQKTAGFDSLHVSPSNLCGGGPSW